MKTEMNTPLGRLVILTDRRYWMAAVANLLDTAEELKVPSIPRMLFYGSGGADGLLTSEELSKFHPPERDNGDPVEYWPKDQTLLIYTDRTILSEMDLKGFIAFELLSHNDNVNGRNSLSYDLNCQESCQLDHPEVCSDYVEICLSSLRNVSLFDRLPHYYRRPRMMREMERAEKAYRDAEGLEDRAQSQLAHLYCLIISTELSFFGETSERTLELKKLSMLSNPQMAEIARFFEKEFKAATERRDPSTEETFIKNVKAVLCRIMRSI